eukprot:SAG31_NODE_3422_length_4294_cov_2.229028_3_plen_71_part_00
MHRGDPPRFQFVERVLSICGHVCCLWMTEYSAFSSVAWANHIHTVHRLESVTCTVQSSNSDLTAMAGLIS